MDVKTGNLIKIKSFFHSKKEYLNLANRIGFKDIDFKDYYNKDDLANNPRLIFGILKKLKLK